MNEYEISLMFEEVEEEILKNLKRVLKNNINNLDVNEMTERDWNRFQVEALKGLEEFKKNNKAIFKGNSKKIQKEVKQMLQDSYSKGLIDTEREIMEMIEKGVIDPNTKTKRHINDRKMNALLKEMQQTTLKASEYAILRAPLDKYRQIIGSAHIYMQSGAGTLWQCVDMATNKYLANGISTIQYKNGANVNIASYSEMALRTANTRATHQGESDMREQWGEHLVMVSSYGACSETCLPWQGRVYIDDVYGNPTKKDIANSPYPCLSEAIAGGLYHPNCRHTHTTYYEGYSDVKKETRGDKEISDVYKAEQQQRAIEREIRKTKRLRDNCLDETTKAKLDKKLNGLNNKMKDHIRTSNKDFGKEVLRRDRAREVNRFKANAQTPKVSQTPLKNYTSKDLSNMSLRELQNVAEQVAIQYYGSGKSGISFGGADYKEAARVLARSGSKTSLQKDILKMQKRMK